MYYKELKAAWSELTSPGAPFEIIPVEVRGETLRCYKNAPPHLRAVFESMRRYGDRDITGHPLLQQKFGGPHHGLGVKMAPHDAIMQRVGDGHDRHALVVGHVGANDRHAFAFGQPCRGEIQRLEVAELSDRAHRAQ